MMLGRAGHALGSAVRDLDSHLVGGHLVVPLISQGGPGVEVHLTWRACWSVGAF